MNCSETENQLDDFLDLQATGPGHEAEPPAATVASHLRGCAACRAELESRRALRAALRNLPVPEPTPGFFQEAMRTATESREPRHRRRGDPPPMRSRATLFAALAATVLVALAVGTLEYPSPESTAPETGLPHITLATDTVTPVKLAFSSETALSGARLSLNLPVGIELVGYDGRSDISWTTDLAAGTNVLRLPLVGRTAASDLLVARLDHATGSKTFRLQVIVTESGANEHEQ